MGKNLSQKKVDVQIGKHGLSESMVTYLKDRLNHSDMVKVRVLKSAIADKDTVKELANEAGKKLHATVRDVRGNTFVISKS